MLEQYEALLEVHERVALPPRATAEGDAVNDILGDELGGVTVRVAEAVAVPPAPVQLTEYVVVCDGETETVPESAPPVLNPVPVHDVAFVELHVSADEYPAEMDVGAKDIDVVGVGETSVYVRVYLLLALEIPVPL